MFESRNKTDLIIEVWEKLDCESVGSEELLAIEQAVIGQFGKSAVDSPMVVARLLADEGAVLRHSEIMGLYVERYSDKPYEPAFRNILNITDFDAALASIKRLENLRRKFSAEGDKEGLRLIREKTQQGRKEALELAESKKLEAIDRLKNAEIAEWLTLWMQSPEMFQTWVELRRASADFKNKFATQRAD
ncbi:MAG: hypothetical protein WBD27_08685 [Pyrinomonadaceae bacterium]